MISLDGKGLHGIGAYATRLMNNSIEIEGALNVRNISKYTKSFPNEVLRLRMENIGFIKRLFTYLSAKTNPFN